LACVKTQKYKKILKAQGLIIYRDCAGNNKMFDLEKRSLHLLD